MRLDSPADWNLHWVVLGLNIQPLLLERIDDLVPDVKSFHALMPFESRNG
jgi:hypothetical protein